MLVHGSLLPSTSTAFRELMNSTKPLECMRYDHSVQSIHPTCSACDTTECSEHYSVPAAVFGRHSQLTMCRCCSTADSGGGLRMPSCCPRMLGRERPSLSSGITDQTRNQSLCCAAFAHEVNTWREERTPAKQHTSPRLQRSLCMWRLGNKMYYR